MADLGDAYLSMGRADQHSAQYRTALETYQQALSIARELGANSLMYQDLKDMASAIGRPIDSICQYCWTGR